jgi:dolichol-phosphate mannosyltransferase
MNFIVIPSLNPGSELVKLIDDLGNRERIVLVDDGSDDKAVFEKLAERTNVFVITHEVNKGKGEALKTAAEYVLRNFPGSGIVTADDDGQHMPEDIIKVKNAVDRNPGALVLGVREFSGENVPLRSKMGNKTTSVIFRIRTGRKLGDTQTGLRGIPAELVKTLPQIPGSRFEYEISMLTTFADLGVDFVMVPVHTVYQTGARKSNYKTVSDSIKIAKSIARKNIHKARIIQFSKYGLSGIVSAAVDFGLYYVFSLYMPVLVSAYIARLISGVFNFTVNRNLVFKASESRARSAVKYIILFAVQLVLTANLTDFLVGAGGNEYISKIAVDLTLFTISFVIQRKFVFKKKAAYNIETQL